MKLNRIERLKEECKPYDFRERLFSLDLTEITDEERFYLKNYGIYNIKMMPEKFMLRIRVSGGRITQKSLETIIRIAKEHHLQLLLTARAQIELHGLTASNILQVWQRLREEKITTLQTLTDNFRNIVTDPYDGFSTANRVEVYPLIRKMQKIFIDKAEWMGMLPRKFNVAICGTARTHTHFFGNDLYFALAQKEKEWGFNFYLGGKNSEAAQPADIFVLPQEVPAMFEAVAKAYVTYGLRESRARTRLFHLISETGMEDFVEKIRSFYHGALREGGLLSMEKGVFNLFEPLKDGTLGYCLQTEFGKVELPKLQEVLEYARINGLQIRLGVDQNLYLLGLKTDTLPFQATKGAAHITACAGSHYCALSLWDIKSETSFLPLEKIEKHQLQVGFSGCLKGCGRHHHADIGLVGLRTNLFGKTQKAARVFLGAEYSRGKSVARLIFPSVPLQHLSQLLEVIVEAYEESDKEDFEAFCEVYLNPYSTFFVMLWFLSRLYLQDPPSLERVSEKALYKKLQSCNGFPCFENNENYLKSIKVMMHALWDDTKAIHIS